MAKTLIRRSTGFLLPLLAALALFTVSQTGAIGALSVQDEETP